MKTCVSASNSSQQTNDCKYKFYKLTRKLSTLNPRLMNVENVCFDRNVSTLSSNKVTACTAGARNTKSVVIFFCQVYRVVVLCQVYSRFAHDVIKIQKSKLYNVHPTKLFLTWYVDTSDTIFHKMFQVLTMFYFRVLQVWNISCKIRHTISDKPWK